MDRVREWISDNLRYILLGLAVILLIVIAFFAVRLIQGIGSGNEEPQQTERQTESGTESVSESSGEDLSLTRNDQNIVNLMTEYFTALQNKDMDTLRTLQDPFDTEDEQAAQNSAIEAYSNIITYSKPGLTEGSYVVYAYADEKITGIDTLVPSLQELYVVTNSDGNLVITDKDSSQELIDYIAERQTDEDVQALVEDVRGKVSDAVAQDTDLEEYVDSLSSENSGTDTSTESESGSQTGTEAGSASAGDTMTATTTVNVRSEASTDGVIYGSLTEGMEVTILESLDSGWSHIQYTTADGTTIEGYVMTQYLTNAQ